MSDRSQPAGTCAAAVKSPFAGLTKRDKEGASRKLPYGNAVLTLSSAAGKPVITGDSPAAREFLTNEADCLLSRMGDPVALADAILRLRNYAALAELYHYGRPDTRYELKISARQPPVFDSGPPFTRCLIDNTALDPAPPEMVAQVPASSRAAGGPLRLCPECGRLYWPGGHVRRMLARLAGWNVP